MPTYPTVPYTSVFPSGSISDIENWFRQQTGPKVAITGVVAGSMTVANQSDANALVGKLILGNVTVSAGGTVATPLLLHDFVIVGPSKDPSFYSYAIDSNGYAVTNDGGAAAAQQAAVNAAHKELISFSSAASNVTVQDIRLDGQNERIYSGFGGASYVTNHLIQRVEITRTGDDGAKVAKNSTYLNNYVHDLRPWVTAADGTFYGAPNNVRFPHQDAFQGLRDGCNIKQSWLEVSNTPTSTSSILMGSALEDISSWTLTECYLHGSNNYPIQFLNQSGAANPGSGYKFLPGSLSITNNLISKDFMGNTSHPTNPYSLAMYSDCVTLAGNLWAEDRTAISNPSLPPRP